MIRSAYAPGIAVDEFRAQIHGVIGILPVQFFLGTRIDSRGVERIVEDSLVRETLRQPKPTLITKRLYLFALILNMPGQRRDSLHRSPAGGQNAYVKSYLYQGDGWLNERLDIDQHLEPWVVNHVALESAWRKFCTNFHYFFEQCQFMVSSQGYVRTFAEYWSPLALQLFFERYQLINENAVLVDFTVAAYESEVYKLLGIPKSLFDEIIDGAAMAYTEKRRDSLIGSEEPASERGIATSGPVGRRLRQVNGLIRSGKNKKELEAWYNGVCQFCGNKVLTSNKRSAVEYAHIKPLGNPHHGPDDLTNMLSLCPNHHRQLDRGAIKLNPINFQIQAPFGSSPVLLSRIQIYQNHKLQKENLDYYDSKIFGKIERDSSS